ncbi:MAG: GNAT family N-acetyltransferase [Rhizobium sp.]|nr:GNAT family N-acetyltransferase [Rhizobium sp.]
MDFTLDTIADVSDASAHAVLYELLGADNMRKSGRPDRSDFAILIRQQPGDAVTGGIWLVDDCGWAFIDLLYVPDSLQGKGLGGRLLAEAELLVRERGLVGLWTNTYDFQSKGFYEKQAFTEFGLLEACPGAAGQSFLMKRF